MPTSPIGRARPETGAMTASPAGMGPCRRARVRSSSSAPAASCAPRTCRCISASSFLSPASTTSTPTRRAKPRGASACRQCSRRSPKPRRRADAIFDVAVPGDQIAGVLKDLPRGSAVLDSETDGRRSRGGAIDREHLPRSRARCRDELSAAVQPERAGASRSASPAQLGEIVDIEVRLVVKQPWHLWTFLERAPRLEILYHSIHYLDTIRALAGEPRGVYCRAVAHPCDARSFRTRAARSSSTTATRCAARCCSTTRISSTRRTVRRS